MPLPDRTHNSLLIQTFLFLSYLIPSESPLLCWVTPAGWRTLPWCFSPIHAVILKNLIRHFHSFKFFGNFRLYNHWHFYRDTMPRKTATHIWRVHSAHETDYPPPHVNPVFYGLEDIIIMIIVFAIVVVIFVIILIIMLLLLLLLLLLILLLLLLLFYMYQMENLNNCSWKYFLVLCKYFRSAT